MPLLLDADRGVASILGQDHLEGQLPLGAERELVAGHQEAAVADETDDRPFRMAERRRDRGRDTETHGARDRREQPLRRREGHDPIDRRAESAGIDRDDGISRQVASDDFDHGLEGHAVVGIETPRRGDAALLGLEPIDPGRTIAAARRGRRSEHLDQGPWVGCDCKIGREVGADHRRIRMHVGEPHLRPHELRKGPALAGDVAQAGAEHEQEVGFAQDRHLRRGVRQPHVAGVEPMAVREEVLPAEGHDGRHLPAFGGGKQSFSPAAPVEAAAGEHERALGRREPRPQGCDVLRMRRRPHQRLRLHRLGIDPGREHILRQRDDDRARKPGHGNLQAAQDRLGNARRIGDLRHPFGDAAEHAGVIDLLERVATQVRRGHLPDQQDQGHRILLRGVDRNRGVARARAAAHAGDAGTAGEARIGERHEARPGFVAAHHRVDAGPAMERVEQREIALARNAEEAVDAMRDEARDDQFSGGRHGCSVHYPALLACQAGRKQAEMQAARKNSGGST